MTGRTSGRVRTADGLVLSAALVLLGAGCSSKAVVTGKVSYQGVPLPGGNVTLVAADGAAYSGTIRPDGTYSVPDVPAGPVKIGVAGPAPANSPFARGGPSPAGGGSVGRGAKTPDGAPSPRTAPGPAPTGPDVPEKYHDPFKSGLTGTVKRGEPLNIDLP